jgi:hypothetical protein
MAAYFGALSSLQPCERPPRQPIVFLRHLEDGGPILGIDQLGRQLARLFGSRVQCPGLLRSDDMA